MRRLFIAALIAAAAAASSAVAQTPGGVAVGAQVGTTGLGAEVQLRAGRYVTLRAGGDLFRYEEEFDTDDIAYEGELDFTTATAAVDLHPFANPFFVSAGAVLGQRTVDVVGRPNRDVVIAGQVVPPPAFGRLVGEADFGGAAPFVGVGFNNTFTHDGRWGFKVMAGAVFGGDPEVALRREGGDPLPPTVQAQFDIERAQEEQELEEELESFKTLPVVQLGLSYRF
jgi:hypothetical protein